MRHVIADLRTLDGVLLCKGAQKRSPDLAHLPPAHHQLLDLANGVSAFHGYFRLFGIGCAGCIDLGWWNNEETWKFAWPSTETRYLAFGETGWGDQYAYDRDALQRGDDTVFLLDSFEMRPEAIASRFEEFMTTEFLRQARKPYDSMTRAAMGSIGRLSWNEHVTYIPSLLLGGEERIENAHKIDARAGMIVNGDIATQSAAEPDRLPSAIETYQDDRGRVRTRVRWAVR